MALFLTRRQERLIKMHPTADMRIERNMTQKPKEHDIGQKAVIAVTHMIFDAGQTPEEVKNDYGEDLLVQTSHQGQMDASRMWVQVKGTAELERHRLKGGDFRLPISFDHALRWVRSLDLVVVVLWDVVDRVGWYAIPRDQVDVYEGVTSGRKSVTLHFAEDNVFTEEAVDRLAWRSRLEHYRMLVLSTQDAEVDLEQEAGIKSGERVLTRLDFTDLVGVTESRSDGDGVRFRVQAELWDEFVEIVQGADVESMGPEEGFRHVIDSAWEAVNRRWRSKQPEVEMPRVLMEEAALAVVDTLEREAGVRERLEAAQAREASEAPKSWWPGKDRDTS